MWDPVNGRRCYQILDIPVLLQVVTDEHASGKDKGIEEDRSGIDPADDTRVMTLSLQNHLFGDLVLKTKDAQSHQVRT